MLRRIQALVMTLMLLPGMVWNNAYPSAQLTDSGKCGDSVYWELVDGILYIYGQGEMETDADYQPWAIYADKIEGIILEEGVTSVGDHAFYSCEEIVYVEIAESVETIEDFAFGFAYYLEDIYIPSNVKHIGANAMPIGVQRIDVARKNRWYSSVDGILFNKDHTTLIDYPSAKEGAEYSVPDSVTKIEIWAFDFCEYLEKLFIPASVASLGEDTRYDYDIGALFWASGISQIEVAKENRWYSSVDGVLFDKTQTILLRYPELKWGRSYAVPDGVTTIDDYAFVYNTELEQVTLPQSVQSIGDYAFSDCSSLEYIQLSGALKSIGFCAFDYCESLTCAKYPGTKKAWDTVTVDQYNEYMTDTLEFGNDPPNVPEEENNGGALTSLDYLAFSHLVYKDLEPYKGKTVRQILEDMGLWSTAWEGREMLYREVYYNIANWELFYVWDYNLGFYVAAFDNNQGDVVISYRGSEAINQENLSTRLDEILKDWIMSDVEMLLNGNDTQVYCAIESYQNVRNMCPDKRITMTGHSLGGALASIAAAYSGDYAETFNAAPFLDIAYFYYADRMGEHFSGTNAWNFRDHVNGGDSVIGAAHLEYKPHFLHNDPLSWKDKGAVLGAHSLKSFIYKTPIGDIAFTNYVEDTLIDSAWLMAIPDIEEISKELLEWATKPGSSMAWLIAKIAAEIDYGMVHLGTDKKDTIRTQLKKSQLAVVFGGDGDDQLFGIRGEEMFIGGPGQDWMDGSYGDDCYLYYKGDGEDYIWDAFGKDTIYLMNFEASDEITIDEWGDRICIWYGDEVILHINKKRSVPTQNTIKLIVGEREIDLAPYFHGMDFYSRFIVSCPVSLEIVEEATGEAVQYIDGTVEELYYTDYGNFYVYQNKSGDYVKVADLAEGYTVRILGDDTGTMDVAVQTTDGVTLSDAYAVKNVSVSKGLVAMVTQDADQSFCLEVDNDGDGAVNEKMQMSVVEDIDSLEDEETKSDGWLPWKNSFSDIFSGDILLVGAVVAVVLLVVVCLVHKRKNKGRSTDSDNKKG